MPRKSFSQQIEAILDESMEEIEKKSNDIFRNAAEECTDVLHKVSPKQKYGSRAGQYAKGWTYKPYQNGKLKGYVVHNATDYELTHLLENGHALWNGTRRVRPRRHIKPVETVMMEKVLEQMPHVTD